jgi:hypothetical protein
MSIVFAEGLDRQADGRTISNNAGLTGKAVDIVCVNLSNQPPVKVVAFNNRNWLTGISTTASNQVSSVSNSYLDLKRLITAIDDTRRSAPGLPESPLAKISVSWKLGWASQNIDSTNGQYPASIGTVNMTWVAPASGPVRTRGYVNCMMVYDRATGGTEFFVDGVLTNSQYTGRFESMRINLLGMRLTGLTAATSYVTDIVVVYDDGIHPAKVPIEVVVRDLALDKVTPAHPDAVIVGGIDVTTAEVLSGVVGTTLVGDGCNEAYKPKAAQAKLGTGVIIGVAVDGRRNPGTPIPADVETKITTPGGATTLLERPTTNAISLQQTIRSLPKPATVKVITDGAVVKLTAKSR